MTINVETVFSYKNTQYQVRMPGVKEQKTALIDYNKTFGAAIASGAVLRAKLHEYMKESKIWSEEKEAQFVKLAKSITEDEDKLRAGGIKLKEATSIAKRLKANRKSIQDFLSQRSIADSNTAEGQAENARFQRLLTLCLVYKDDGRQVFNTLEELLDDRDEDKNQIAIQAFEILGKLLYKLDDSFEAKLPENQFLRDWNLIDDKLRFINEKGQLVDENGKLINEEGNWINDKGELVDFNGDRITEDGYKVIDEPKPFLDDDGNPIEKPKK
jgi:hypothetical protein